MMLTVFSFLSLDAVSYFAAAQPCDPGPNITAQPFPLRNFTWISLMSAMPKSDTWVWKWFPNRSYPFDYQKHVDAIINCSRKNGGPGGIRQKLIVGLHMGQSPAMFQAALNDWNPFIASLLQLLERNGLDGINLDWEVDIDYSVLLQFIKNLRNSFQSKYMIKLSVTDGTPFYSVREEVDAFGMMSYEGTEDCQWRLNNAIGAGMPVGKLLCGVEVEPHWSGCPGWNTKQSTIGKVQIVAQNNMQGIFSWRLDNDHGYGWPNCSSDCPPSYEGSREMYEAAMSSSHPNMVISTYLPINNPMTQLQLSCQ